MSMAGAHLREANAVVAVRWIDRLSLAIDNISRGLLELAWPTRCACCELPHTLLCKDCDEALPRIAAKTACPRCGAPYGAVACTECWSADGLVERPFESARCALEFNDASAKLVLAYKDGGERALAPILAQLLVDALDPELLDHEDCLTYVPASSEALRRRGFDHMERIASEVSALTGLECVQLLVANSRLDQRELTREERAANMSGAFELLVSPYELPRRVLLIDDVFTTGSTLTAVTEVLLGGGVQRVDVGAICRVW